MSSPTVPANGACRQAPIPLLQNAGGRIDRALSRPLRACASCLARGCPAQACGLNELWRTRPPGTVGISSNRRCGRCRPTHMSGPCLGAARSTSGRAGLRPTPHSFEEDAGRPRPPQLARAIRASSPYRAAPSRYAPPSIASRVCRHGALLSRVSLQVRHDHADLSPLPSRTTLGEMGAVLSAPYARHRLRRAARYRQPRWGGHNLSGGAAGCAILHGRDTEQLQLATSGGADQGPGRAIAVVPGADELAARASSPALRSAGAEAEAALPVPPARWRHTATMRARRGAEPLAGRCSDESSAPLCAPMGAWASATGVPIVSRRIVRPALLILGTDRISSPTSAGSRRRRSTPAGRRARGDAGEPFLACCPGVCVGNLVAPAARCRNPVVRSTLAARPRARSVPAISSHAVLRQLEAARYGSIRRIKGAAISSDEALLRLRVAPCWSLAIGGVRRARQRQPPRLVPMD